MRTSLRKPGNDAPDTDDAGDLDVAAAQPAPSRSRRTSPWPWITAGVAALVVAGLVLALVFTDHKHAGPAGQLTKDEQTAVAAAGTDAANLATLSRANFAKDYARALAGTTGSLYTDVSKLQATTKSSLTTGKFDITATVKHAALVGPASNASKKIDAYVVLVALYGYHSTSPTIPNPQNLQVTVQKVKGVWLANDVTAIGVQ